MGATSIDAAASGDSVSSLTRSGSWVEAMSSAPARSRRSGRTTDRATPRAAASTMRSTSSVIRPKVSADCWAELCSWPARLTMSLEITVSAFCMAVRSSPMPVSHMNRPRGSSVAGVPGFSGTPFRLAISWLPGTVRPVSVLPLLMRKSVLSLMKTFCSKSSAMLVAAAPDGEFTSFTSSTACSSLTALKKMSRSDCSRSEARESACSEAWSMVRMTGELAVPPLVE